MRIYVDADGFPTAAKDLLIRAAARLHVPLVFVANKQVNYKPSVNISSIIVPEGPDLADNRIVDLAQPGDLVITADIPLADRVVAKGAFALNPRGKFYTEDNIKDRLAMRDLMNDLRDGGMMTGGPSTFSKKDCQAFVNQLDSFLTRHLKNKGASPRQQSPSSNQQSAESSISPRFQIGITTVQKKRVSNNSRKIIDFHF